MKTLLIAFLFVSLHSFAQVNPNHKTIACSSAVDSAALETILYTAPNSLSYGTESDASNASDSISILNKKVDASNIVFTVNFRLDPEAKPFTIVMSRATGKARMNCNTHRCYSDVEYICKSTNQDLSDPFAFDAFLKANRMPYIVCPLEIDTNDYCVLHNAQ